MNSSYYVLYCSRIFLCVQINGLLYLVICINLILSVPIVLVNTYIVGITYYCRNMHNPANILLAVTSFCDLLVGTFSIFPWETVYIMSTLHSHNCSLFLFANFTSYSFGILSFLLVCLGSIDRYIAVFQPFFYQKYIHNNPRLYVKLVCIIAVFVFLLTGLSFLTENRKLIELVIIYFIPILIMVVLYIHTKLHNRVKMIRRIISTQNPKTNFSDENENNFDKNKNRQEKKRSNLVLGKKVNKNLKINNITLMIYLSTCIAYLPYISLLCLWHFKSVSYYWQWTYIFYRWGQTLTLTKSLTNPAIYFYRSKILRKSFRRSRIRQSESIKNKVNQPERGMQPNHNKVSQQGSDMQTNHIKVI
nr:5-hydroxytryptamine receptor 1B-like [Hydra vulgaris]